MWAPRLRAELRLVCLLSPSYHTSIPFSFLSLPELVKDGRNGLIFNDSNELTQQFEVSNYQRY